MIFVNRRKKKQNLFFYSMECADAVKRAQIHKWQSIRLKTVWRQIWSVYVSVNISENRSQVTLIILSQCVCVRERVFVAPDLFHFSSLSFLGRCVAKLAKSSEKGRSRFHTILFSLFIIFGTQRRVWVFVCITLLCVPCLCSSVVVVVVVVVATECVQHILILNINW